MLFSFSTLLTFSLATIALVLVPGPSLSIIIANSLRHGARAGIMNVIGGQLGLLVLILLLALGLETLTTTLAWLFDWIRFAGALYLVWLGINLWRSDGTFGANKAKGDGKTSTLFWQGFFVAVSNPKTLMFFGAFLPQFIDPSANTALQTFLLGVLFMFWAALFDSGFAFTAGRASDMLTKNRVRGVEIGAGSMMIGGGLWIALARN